ncbi:MAG: DUF1614 domain-containing protein [Nitrososphaerota archaeon]|nr:DUF1614 domain-containing protein [Nitrososphaerota archaeon]
MTLTITVVVLSSIQIFTEALMIPPEIALIALYVSLIGSMINIPITSIKTLDYGLVYEEINIFGIRWFLPSIGLRERKTIILINLGGAIIPITISTYILIRIILNPIVNLQISLTRIFVAIIIVSLIVNRFAKIIPRFGIVIPGFIPPTITAIISIALATIPPKCNPSIIAYISGTMGTLIGADLLNLRKMPKIGSSMVSIGGAGTFDGIYLTGLVASALTLIIM